MSIHIRILSRHVWLFEFVGSHRFKRLRSIPKKILFLDLDGTLWPDKGPGEILKFQRLSKEWRVYISQVKREGYDLAIFTNQTLFCRSSKFHISKLFRYLWNLGKLFYEIRPVAFLVCHHHPNAQFEALKLDCSFRKPAPALMHHILNRFQYDAGLSFLIGDKITDAISGNLAGIGSSILKVSPEMFFCNVSGNYPDSCYAFFKPLYSDAPAVLHG